jgi:hypothetical protein
VSSAAEDDRWQSHYTNAAERLFGWREGRGGLSEEQDDACIAEANARLADEIRMGNGPS